MIVESAGLVRAIGTRRLALSVVNATVGAGIFVLPALVAIEAGSASPLVYLICAAAMALIVTCFAAAGSRVALTGGVYAYTEVAFGPLAGFIAGILYWVAATLSVASVASALIASLASAWPAVGDPGLGTVVLLAAIAFVAGINVRGVGSGAWTIEVVTVAKLLPLLILIAGGALIGVGAPVPTSDVSWNDWRAADLGRAAVVLMFAFIGVEMALVPSGEVRNPARTVPRAVFSALAFTTVLYLLVQATAQRVLGPALTQFTAAPLAEAASRLLGDTGRSLVLAGASVSMFGYVAGDMLCTPRSLYALGRDRMLPAGLAAVHPRFRTPWIAIVVHAAIVFALAARGTFAQLAILTNVVSLLLYLVCVGAAFELQRRDVREAGNPFVLRGGALVPVLASAVIVWLLSHASAAELRFGGAVVGLAALLYGLRRAAGGAHSTIERMANPSDDQLRQILTSARTIAMVGASSNPEKPSHGIMKRLQTVGYRVIPVNPHEEEVLGERAYPSLTDVPEKVDIVDVFRRPEDTPAVAEEAVRIGAKVLWLQQGIASEEAAALARDGGLEVVMNACIAATHSALRIPKR